MLPSAIAARVPPSVRRQGAVRGRRQSRRAKRKAAEETQQEAQAQEQSAGETFNEAWGACLDGREFNGEGFIIVPHRSEFEGSFSVQAAGRPVID